MSGIPIFYRLVKHPYFFVKSFAYITKVSHLSCREAIVILHCQFTPNCFCGLDKSPLILRIKMLQRCDGEVCFSLP